LNNSPIDRPSIDYETDRVFISPIGFDFNAAGREAADVAQFRIRF